jgi:hypothetical protein
MAAMITIKMSTGGLLGGTTIGTGATTGGFNAGAAGFAGPNICEKSSAAGPLGAGAGGAERGV